MEVVNGTRLYSVGKQVAVAPAYRLFLCRDEESGRQCLLQIAGSVEHNSGLDRAAYILQELKHRSDELEEEYAKVKAEPQMMLNYQLGFPELIDGFTSQEQGNRRINIVAFRNVDEPSQLVPIANLARKDHVRVDLRTSAWIGGKLLKDLVLSHDTGVFVHLVNGNNVLIEPKEHYVLVFDFSSSKTYQGKIPAPERRKDIANAAQTVLAVLGADLAKGIVPDDGEEGFDQYISYLLKLARGSESIAERAHKKFYEIVHSLWEHKYHPFTVKPL
jgi:hypothetical protein